VADALLEAGSFQMQSWSSREGRWTPMEDGAASKVWRPVPSVEAAVRHCMEWTGTPSIPAMRVVDLRDGSVAWQESSHYPDAGASIVPDWSSPILAAVKAEQRAQADRERAELVVGGVTTDLGAAADETIAAMLGAVGVAAPAAVPAPVDDGALFTMGEFDV
jgi:hypothetical protein